jgi:hypothetical protein
LASNLPKDTRYYSDLVHFSNIGAAKVAEIVTSPLMATLERLGAGRVRAER